MTASRGGDWRCHGRIRCLPNVRGRMRSHFWRGASQTLNADHPAASQGHRDLRDFHEMFDFNTPNANFTLIRGFRHDSNRGFGTRLFVGPDRVLSGAICRLLFGET